MTVQISLDPAQDRANQLLALTERLVGLVREEAEAVAAGRLDSSAANWEEKERLAHAWRLEVGRIRAEPVLIAAADEPTKAALRLASKTLQEHLEAHAVALAARRTVTEGLVRSIATEIASARGAPQGYGRAGGLTQGQHREASGLAVNAKV